MAAGQSLTLDIQLQLGGLTETVTVLGQEVTRSRNTIERVQDVPLSISIVPGTELEKTEATGIAAITQRVANVSWNFGNQRTSSLSIRGVGKQGQTEAQDPSVGVIVDGVNYAYNALTSALRLHRRGIGGGHARTAGHAAGQEHQPGRHQRHHQAPELHAERRCLGDAWRSSAPCSRASPPAVRSTTTSPGAGRSARARATATCTTATTGT